MMSMLMQLMILLMMINKKVMISKNSHLDLATGVMTLMMKTKFTFTLLAGYISAL